MRGLGCFLALCIVGSSFLLAQPAFLRKDILVERPLAVVAGDFNGDGRPDLAVATVDGLFTLLNTGGGNFGRPIRTEGIAGTDLTTGYLTQFVGAVDFDGDGKADLVGNGVLLLGRGDGTFTVSRRDLAIVVGAADFNRDGKIDLLQADTQGSLRVLLGNGDGSFRVGATLTTPHREPEVFSPVVADFNRDGRIDVGVRSWPLPDGPVFRVFLGQGDGTFRPDVATKLNCGPGCPALAADFNGDGLPDLISQGGIALGKGDGTFQPPIFSLSATNPFYIAVADVTGDGRTDLVTAPGGSTISIAPGKGDGTLLPPMVESGGSFSYPGIAADLDGDGRLDLVVVNQNSNSVSVLFSRAQGGAAVRRAVSAAGGIAIVAPESLATLSAPTPATASLSGFLNPGWPTSLSGISLEVRDCAGTARLAPLLYVSPTQINFQVPAGTALGEAALAIVSAAGTTPAGGMQVDAVAPGLFMISGTTPAATGVLLEPDGTQVPIPVFTCSPSPGGVTCEASPIPLSTAGNRPIYLSFFGTGFRGAKADNVTCSVNGVQVPVIYAGPQETPGLDQINIRLRPEVLEDLFFEGMPVTIRINGVAANGTWIAVQ